MPVMDGLEAARTIRARWPERKVLMLTTFNDDQYAFEALKSGASGYMLKNAEPEALIRSIRSCLTGGLFLQDDVAAKVIPRLLKRDDPKQDNAEKTSGIWNRMILSPLHKTEMYTGHLLYCFLIGFVQILLVFLIFYGFGFNLGERFGMLLVVVAIFTLTMVSFAMLISGITRTPESFNTVFTSIVPLLPLLSGVYIPPAMNNNPILLAVAEFIPLTHAMTALMGITVFNMGWSELSIPIAKLLLIGVICMGIGINLVERQKA
jgi:ABC-type multidrug transport system permease subunit